MKLPPSLRWLGSTVGALALTGVLAASSSAGLLLHADLPVTRRVLADTLSQLLSDYFIGTIEISNVTEFGRRGITVQRASVYDSFQNRVLLLEDLKVRANLVDMIEKLLSDEQKISLVIRHVRVERGDVRIVEHPKTSVPTIAEAFTPRVEGDDQPSTRYIRVWLPTIEVGKAFGRGTVAGSPTLEADLRGTLGSVLVTPKGVAVDVTRFGLDLRGLGGADAHGPGSLHVRAPGPIWGNFDGYLGEVQLGAFVHYEDERLKTRLALPSATPEDVRAIWQDYPIYQEVSARIEAEGPVDELDARVRMSVGPATLQATGVVRTRDELNIDVEAHTEGFDLRAVLPDAPQTSLEATAAILAYRKDGKTTVEFNGFTQPGTVADVAVPAIDAHGTYDEVGLASRATVHEPGLPAKLSFDMTPDGVINLKLDAKRFPLNHPRIRPYVKATGFAEGTVQTKIDEQVLTASFDADLSALRYEDIALQRGRLTGTAQGHINDLDRLDIDAHLTGTSFSRGGTNFESVDVVADGPVSRPRLEAKLENPGGQRITAQGAITTKGAPHVDDLKLGVHHQGADLEIAATELESNDEGIRIQNLVVVQGDKELRGDVIVNRDLIQIQAKGEDIDLDAVSRALGLKPGTLSGRLTVDADVTSARDIEQGQIKFHIENTKLGEFESVSARGVVSIDEGRVVASTEVDVDELGRVGIELEGRLGGKARDIEAWKTMTGSSIVNVYAIDLAYLTRYLDPSWKIRDLRGLATARVRLEREDGSGPPSAFLDANTQNLQVTLEDDGDAATVETIQGIDVQLGGAIDAPSGTTSGTARLVDREGTLVSTSGTARIDWKRLYADPSVVGEVFGDTQVETVFVVPPRRLQQLPVQLRIAGLEGEISGRVSMSGPVSGPTYNALLSVDKLHGTATALTRPVRLQARVNYTEPTGVVGGNIEAHQRASRILWGSFQGRLHDDDGEQPPVTGSARFQVEDLPLELLQPLSRAEIGGKLNGTIAISRQHSQPDLNLDLDLRDGSIQGIPLGPGHVLLRSRESDVLAKATFGDARGWLRAEVRTRTDWSDSELRFRDAVTLELKSNRYDSVLLLPFVDELFTELNGPLDADVRVVLEPPKETEEKGATAERWTANFSGHAKLRGGEVEPVDLGLKLTDADVNLVATREGNYNVVELTSIHARARSDEKNLNGAGKLYFDGIELSHGWASIGAKKVPFIVQGVRMADMTGQVGTSFRANDDHMSANVDLPSLHVELPRSSGRDLIELDENEDIIVVQPLGPPREESEAGLPWHIDFSLGNDVRVRSNALNLRVTGKPKMIIGEKVDVTGKLYLPDGGRVLVAGKLFVIEHGFIQFDTDDFTNPHVSITSTWRTPSGILITAYLRGTVQEPELSLESDPALPGGEDEIYALLFGGGSGQEGASSADPALAAGAAMLSSVLDNTELEGVELRAGEEKQRGSGQLSTISEGTLKSYAAAVQVSDQVWFEATYKSETGTLGSEGHSGFGGTVDWRFKEDWALRTELGELGAGVDLLWRYRY